MQSLNRSNSLLGTLKSFVSSNIPWFRSTDEFGDLQGKRKGAPAENDEPEDAPEHRIKRKRMHSPEPESQQPDPVVRAKSLQLFQPKPQRVQSGYLDPPSEVFHRQATNGQRPLPNHGRASSLAVHDRPPHRGTRTRRTDSPGPTDLYAPTNGLARTRSMDPPPRQRSAFEPTAAPQAISRDVSMEGFRDKSRSPTSRPFRMRTSMTPQPTGQGFGPAPARRERDASEPPPLAALIENPIFVKAPSQPPPDRQDLEKHAPITLGNVAEAQRRARPLKRSRSSLNLDDTSMADVPNKVVPLYPINAAEKALRELEVYKTPLLPTRLQGSASIPDMFQTQSKKARVPVLMHDRDHKPRLGMSDKTRGRERKAEGQESPGVNPYAGRGGMKKLLARRRMEEEEAHHKERLLRLSVIEETDEEEEEAHMEEAVREAEPERQERRPRIIGGREQSSLRVGRQRSGRNHITRPQVKPKSRAGRYAAIFDEEDEDSMVMDEEAARELRMLEEAAKNVPEFKPPPSFSFAKETAAAPPIQQDESAKEPPIAALPFSISKSSTPSSLSSASSRMSVDKPSPPVPSPFAAQTSATTPSVTTTTSAPSMPAPTPETNVSKPGPEATSFSQIATPASEIRDETLKKAAPAIPDFFSNSAIFQKPTVSVSTQTTFSLVPSSAPATEEKKEEKPAQAAVPSFFTFGKAPETAKKGAVPAAPSLFGTASTTAPGVEAQKASTPASSLITAEPSVAQAKEVKSAFPPTAASITAAPSTSLFGAAAPAATTPSAKETTPAPATPFSFGAPAKPAEQAAPAVSPFTFGASAKPAEQPATTPTLGAPFTFGAPTKAAETATPTAASGISAPFTFGAPKTEAVPAETKAVEPSAPATTPGLAILGAASKPFSFGAPASAGTPAAESAKTAFMFGQPAAQPSTPATSSAVTTPTIEAPKPLFGGTPGFTFGQPAQASAPSVTTEPAKSQSPFAFGAPSTTATTTENKPFTFGTPSPAPPSTPVGGAGGSLSFGGTSGTAATTETPTKQPFAFGAPSTPAAPRPLTPPKNSDSSMVMDESPIRSVGMELNGGKSEAPKLNGFSFGVSSATPSPFGQPAAGTTSGFSFGSGTSTASPFGTKPAETKQSEKPSGFGFGQPSTTTGFGFGQKPAELAAASATGGFNFGQKAPDNTSTPATGGFTFGQKAPETAAPPSSGFSFGSPATPTAPAAPFGFGAPQISRSSSFGQPPSATTPTAASPFGQTAPSSGFTFAATPTSATAPSNPFAFGGSQPASPATTNAGLPSQPTSTGFTFGAPSTTAAAGGTPSPFGAPAPLPATGAPSFTMGAAPVASTIARPIKKMPTRRGKR